MTPNSDTGSDRGALLIRSVRNILAIEARDGYPNRAVRGGLDLFLDTLRGEAASHPALRALAGQGLLSVVYAELGPDKRRLWAEEAARLVGRGEAATRSDPPPSPPSASSHVQAGERAEGAGRASSNPSSQQEEGAKEPARPRSGRRSKAASGGESAPPVSLDAPLVQLRGVTSAHAAKLLKAGVATVRDLLYTFPNRHLDYSRRRSIRQLVSGEEQTIIATLWEAHDLQLGARGRLRATQAVVGDDTGNIRAIWFGQPWLARQFNNALASGPVRIVLSGKADAFNGRLQFENPEWELLDGPGTADLAGLAHTGRLVPVYPSHDNIPARAMRNIVRAALQAATRNGRIQIDDPLPEDHRQHAELPTLPWAIDQAHYPASEANKELARRRLAFDEFLTLQLAVGLKRGAAEQEPGIPLPANPPIIRSFIASLPFALTKGQEAALAEAMRDISSGERPMNRLLQGDVGSGKTVVALALLLAAAADGRQGAIMAPTEVLAEQHFFNIRRLLGSLPWTIDNPDWFAVPIDGREQPVVVGLLTGSTRAKPRREIQHMTAAGGLDILVGTHALIQQGVELPGLALAVVDEQHRFGVLQRAALRGKGASPHLLLMSATPIPRTLALTVYGDLDVSTIAELPSGRKEIKTRVVEPPQARQAEEFLVEQVRQGRQCFVVCPLIDESESVLARAATAEFERLRSTSLAGVRVGLLHGRLPLAEKQAVMDQFRAGETDVLVATPVIEVGVDVPNASVMMILGANRFGLAQLHQLRGRVGRGELQSYCFLLAEPPPDDSAGASEEEREEARKRAHATRERLGILARTNDGFVIAEEDLRLRGPGDFFGTRQSGLPALRMARFDDRDILAASRENAQAFLSADPALSAYPALREAVLRFTAAVTPNPRSPSPFAEKARQSR